MMFARRSHGLIPMSRSSRRGRRPSRARGPGLVVEGCEGRMLLSTALVSVERRGDRRRQQRLRLRHHDHRRPQLGEPVAVAQGQPQRRRDEAGLRQRGDRPGQRPRRHQPRQRRLRPRPGDRPDDAGQRDPLRPGRQRGLVRSRDQPRRPVRRVPQRRHQPVHGPRLAGRPRGRCDRRRQPDCRIPLRPRPGDGHDHADGPDARRRRLGRLLHRPVRLQPEQPVPRLHRHLGQPDRRPGRPQQPRAQLAPGHERLCGHSRTTCMCATWRRRPRRW